MRRDQERQILLRTPVLALLACAVGLPATTQAKDWEWTVAPYFWVADVGMDLTLNGEPALGTTVPFSDIIDKLDSAFMAHLEARNDRWGLYVDIIGMSVSDGAVTPVGPGGPIVGDLVTNTKLELGLVDLGAMRRFGPERPGGAVFDFLVGARTVDIDVTANVVLPGPAMTPVDFAVGPTETDLMFGGRFTGYFNERWHWRLHGDFSFGGTEGTVNGLASVGYTFGQGLFALDAGYRHMRIDFTGTTGGAGTTDSELTFSGPVIGAVFSF